MKEKSGVNVDKLAQIINSQFFISFILISLHHIFNYGFKKSLKIQFCTS